MGIRNRCIFTYLNPYLNYKNMFKRLKLFMEKTSENRLRGKHAAYML